MVKVTVKHESIKKEIERNIKNPFDALNEYIWNSIDANAKNINIEIAHDKNFINSLSISDDGTGINREQLETTLFKDLNVSWKSQEEEAKHSLPHGKNGFGRFSFILFSSKAKWDTVYKSQDGIIYKYSIEINRETLDDFNPTEKETTDSKLGTRVTFYFEGLRDPGKLISPGEDHLQKLKRELSSEFGWIIELLELNITINGNKLDMSEITESREDYVNIVAKDINIQVKFVKWKYSLANQHSRIYFIDSLGNEAFVRNSKLDGKGDNFFHSLYIKSAYFNGYRDSDDFAIRFSSDFQNIWELVMKYLKERRDPFIKKFSIEKYAEFEKKELIPKFNYLENEVKKPLYREVVIEVLGFAPSLVTQANESQKRILLQLINRLIDDESSRNTLYDILEVLVDEENRALLEELKEKLKNYGLRNILGTIRLIEDRFNTLKSLEKLIYEESQYYQESDLQKAIQDHFWIFGEEYHLLVGAEEDDFNKIYHSFCDKVLGIKPEDVKGLSKKQVDLLISGQTQEGRLNKHLVVEIKNPNKSLIEDHYHQLEKYKSEIKKMPNINSETRHSWNFILLYTEISKEHEGYFEDKITNKFTGETADSKPDSVMRVIKWSDLIDECKGRLRFLRDKLELKKNNLKPSTNNKVLDLLNNSAKRNSANK